MLVHMCLLQAADTHTTCKPEHHQKDQDDLQLMTLCMSEKSQQKREDRRNTYMHAEDKHCTVGPS